MARRRAGARLDEGQSSDHVWQNAVLCANCRQEWSEHCKVHIIACCPGQCPAETS